MSGFYLFTFTPTPDSSEDLVVPLIVLFIGLFIILVVAIIISILLYRGWKARQSEVKEECRFCDDRHESVTWYATVLRTGIRYTSTGIMERAPNMPDDTLPVSSTDLQAPTVSSLSFWTCKSTEHSNDPVFEVVEGVCDVTVGRRTRQLPLIGRVCRLNAECAPDGSRVAHPAVPPSDSTHDGQRELTAIVYWPPLTTNDDAVWQMRDAALSPSPHSPRRAGGTATATKLAAPSKSLSSTANLAGSIPDLALDGAYASEAWGASASAAGGTSSPRGGGAGTGMEPFPYLGADAAADGAAALRIPLLALRVRVAVRRVDPSNPADTPRTARTASARGRGATFVIEGAPSRGEHTHRSAGDPILSPRSLRDTATTSARRSHVYIARGYVAVLAEVDPSWRISAGTAAATGAPLALSQLLNDAMGPRAWAAGVRATTNGHTTPATATGYGTVGAATPAPRSLFTHARAMYEIHLHGQWEACGMCGCEATYPHALAAATDFERPMAYGSVLATTPAGMLALPSTTAFFSFTSAGRPAIAGSLYAPPLTGGSAGTTTGGGGYGGGGAVDPASYAPGLGGAVSVRSTYDPVPYPPTTPTAARRAPAGSPSPAGLTAAAALRDPSPIPLTGPSVLPTTATFGGSGEGIASPSYSHALYNQQQHAVSFSGAAPPQPRASRSNSNNGTLTRSGSGTVARALPPSLRASASGRPASAGRTSGGSQTAMSPRPTTSSAPTGAAPGGVTVPHVVPSLPLPPTVASPGGFFITPTHALPPSASPSDASLVYSPTAVPLPRPATAGGPVPAPVGAVSRAPPHPLLSPGGTHAAAGDPLAGQRALIASAAGGYGYAAPPRPAQQQQQQQPQTRYTNGAV